MEHPNIIIIMVDDMGFSDLGCYGSEIETPNIDKLAYNGIRLTRFHNTARCCPSRACVLTGLYPHQTGVGYMVGAGQGIAYQGSMKRPNVTIGEVFSSNGYDTIMCGKWHVGGPDAKNRGFNKVSAYIPQGCRSYFPERKEKFSYLTDWISDSVLENIKSSDGPFMVYWTPTAPHYPLHAKEADVAKYRGRYACGPRAIAEERFERMKGLGIVEDGDWHPPKLLSEKNDHVTGYRLDTDDSTNYVRTTWQSKRFNNTRKTYTPDEGMEVYAAMIDALDQSVGRVVDYLEETDQLNNTLIMFCSDNGCSAENDSIGKIWAQVCDTPFLKWKKSAWEGGNCTPFIMHWPDMISEDQMGTINRTTGHLIDIIATAMDAAGIEYPTHDRNGDPIPECEGHSLLGILNGEEVPLPRPIFIEHGGNRGVITEKWKLTADTGEDWQLFDLDCDRFERNNVAGSNPEIVEYLAEQWNEWAFRVDAREDGGRPEKNKHLFEIYKKRIGK